MPSQLIRENPAHPKQCVGSVSISSPLEVDRCVRLAEQAHQSWRRLQVADRADLLLAAVEQITAHEQDAIATTLCLELGKPLWACKAELMRALDVMRHLAISGPFLLEPTRVDDRQGCRILNKIPYGVVAGFVPWNAPLAVAALKLAPALVCGNAIIIKSSPLSPLALADFVHVLTRTLPRDVLQIIHGFTPAAEALVKNPAVRKLSFTGGESVAMQIQAACSGLIRPSLMELGGNDAALVLDDLQFTDTIIERLVMGCFLGSGQICVGCKRIYVPSSRVQAFCDAFIRVSNRVLRLGDPMNPEVTIGPVVSRESQQKCEAMIAKAAAEPLTQIVRLGRVIDAESFATGYFVKPSIVIGCSDHSPIVCEEQFAPVVPILTYDTVDEALQRINANEHGLGGSVWSSDQQLACSLAARFESGIVFVNAHGPSGLRPEVPFGGVKRSGFGRESGEQGILEYCQYQSIVIPRSS